ncbi:hypothetical protein [Pseudomonas aeruginosa]|uniref:hypothetical protein n=1 Tax=Pseudomonas aeruginosa TaxID=287 RepID=UPI001325E2FB|nr:hypothetical protein [Pseudomonas aeruginosa]MXP72842.1 hypothetical protein [Pseudomonas aeruginosa]MXP92187.1 hypothetical protein [Pseudomonas aeruginosa]MXQ04802.1 hypothetical protein [Pseudomonas aeruginosa]MXQ19325.1 hypothetical protein [Pseudomonas aeruginosa]MXQ30028.1 hypothetical protein [Pseudomonas aeruginosa]
MSETMFQVITDPKEIRRLNDQLGKIIAKRFPYKQKRELTYPAGHHTGRVFFEDEHGSHVRGWSPKDSDPKKHVNHLLFGDPGNTSWLELAVQLNFPKETYNRSVAGAFVRDPNGEIFLAHRGKLTKGHAGLPKDLVLSQFSTTINVQDGKQRNRVILIEGLERPQMLTKLFEFADEARSVATRIAAGQVQRGNRKSSETVITGNQKQRKAKGEPMTLLSAYVDEFSGETKSTQPVMSGTRVVKHGAIVSALYKALGGGGNLRKSQAIDLAALRNGSVDLFEVKTSASTQSIYTAVGQLLIHGEAIKARLGLKVRRYLVLPELPREDFIKPIRLELGGEIIQYSEKGSGYVFTGLN